MHSLIAVDVLVEGLARYAEIVYLPMVESVVQLDIIDGHATLYLDTGSTPAEMCSALTDALLVFALGPNAATSAEPVRRLHSVS